MSAELSASGVGRLTCHRAKQALVILVTLRVAAPPGRYEELVGGFWSVIGPVRVEPGCTACGLYRDASEGDELLYVEEWQSEEALERHMRSARYDRLLAIMETSARPPELRYLSISVVRGLEHLEVVRLGTPPASAGSVSG
jgi:quinol monooxygenase YgiN